MPILLVLAASAGGLWAFKDKIEESAALIKKGLIIGAVAYVAWENRAAIVKVFK